ncbi:MAG: Gfo/Idh/MocA family protein [Candidatus Brocadiia bacterium]
MMSEIRYAVVGLNHGRGHVKCALESDDIELVALCDRDEKVLNNVGEKDLKRFTHYGELVTWGEFDAVVIAVPPSLHKKFSLRALDAGKHVLVEKPLTDNLEDSYELKKAAHNAETVFQVGYCVRSSPLIRRLREMIRSDQLGQITSVWFDMFLKYPGGKQDWRQSRETRGGKLFDCMPHYFDVMQLLAGARFERLSAFGHEPGKTGVNADRIPTIASVMLEYRNGVKGTHLLSGVTPVTGNSSHFGVAGTRGIVYGNPWDPDGAGSLECQLEDGLYQNTIRINGDMASRGHLGFREQHEAFVRIIKTGDGNPCTADEAYEVDVTMEAIDRSLTTGKTISREDILL